MLSCMKTELKETYAFRASTERGRGILISGDPKSNSVLFCNGGIRDSLAPRSPASRSPSTPSTPTMSPSPRYSPTVSGSPLAISPASSPIWGTRNEFVLKNEYECSPRARIDDFPVVPDGMRIVACGDGKGKSFVKAPFIFWRAFLEGGSIAAMKNEVDVGNQPKDQSTRWKLKAIGWRPRDGKLRVLLCKQAILSKNRPSWKSNRGPYYCDPMKLKDKLYHTARIELLGNGPLTHKVATGANWTTHVIVYELSKAPSDSETNYQGSSSKLGCMDFLLLNDIVFDELWGGRLVFAFGPLNAPA
nr:actin-interacting protein 1-2-like [Ipomoea batatas]GMD32527.1 actin-interacting protein 1-2-like [Ipomoea batatas]